MQCQSATTVNTIQGTSTTTNTIQETSNRNNIQETATNSSNTSNNSGIQGTIRLQGSSNTTNQVRFEEGVVDNEFLNKRKSKICCIYKKPYDPNYSSESDSEGEGNSYETQPKYKCSH
jgi:protein phosphatase 1 regulatory subunit 11